MKVFIVDDSQVVRERLIGMLSELEDVDIIGQAEDAREATEAIRKLKPDVVLLDIHMPGGSGIDVLQNIKQEEPAPIVIMLTNYPYPQYRKKCTDAKADFFLDKSTEFEKVIEIFRGLIGSNGSEVKLPQNQTGNEVVRSQSPEHFSAQ